MFKLMLLAPVAKETLIYVSVAAWALEGKHKIKAKRNSIMLQNFFIFLSPPFFVLYFTFYLLLG